MKVGGVFRLSFPGLEGVLSKHFNTECNQHSDLLTKSIHESYLMWGHMHFYSKEEISLVAKHIGFTEIHFEDFQKSSSKELTGLELRESQKNLNTYVELTK